MLPSNRKSKVGLKIGVLSAATFLAVYNLYAFTANTTPVIPATQKDVPPSNEELGSSSTTSRRDLKIKRTLSLELAGGGCEWTKAHNAPQNGELFSTVLTAYPGSGKRVAFMQLEGLTELTTSDDHHITENSHLKYAFMKTSYPHHEGIWSWGNTMDQSILLIRNPRWALVDYATIEHEIHYGHVHSVYTMRQPIADWIAWKLLRFRQEIYWYSWHLDYWMEGGLMRDVYSNNLTTPEHFQLSNQNILSDEAFIIDQEHIELGDIEPTYDPHCDVGDMVDCTPAAIASYERILNEETGPQEMEKFVSTIVGKPGINVIGEASRACVWHELIDHKKSDVRDYRDREGPPLESYTFTREEMVLINTQLESLVEKYSSGIWASKPLAIEVVTYLTGYILENQNELSNMP